MAESRRSRSKSSSRTSARRSRKGATSTPCRAKRSSPTFRSGSGQEIRGEMMNAEQARGVYEGIVRRLKDPALLTLAGHGLVRAQVFPVQPGETRKVVLRYTQLLDRA